MKQLTDRLFNPLETPLHFSSFFQSRALQNLGGLVHPCCEPTIPNTLIQLSECSSPCGLRSGYPYFHQLYNALGIPKPVRKKNEAQDRWIVRKTIRKQTKERAKRTEPTNDKQRINPAIVIHHRMDSCFLCLTLTRRRYAPCLCICSTASRLQFFVFNDTLIRIQKDGERHTGVQKCL